MNNGDSNVVWEGQYLRVMVTGTWEHVERKNISGIVGMVPVTDDGCVVLVEQFRPPLGRRVIELPAGLVGDVSGFEDEPFETAALRELEEETGYTASSMTRLFEGVASPGLTGESVTFFLATGLKKVGPGGGDETEDIIVHEVPVDGLLDWLRDQENQGHCIDLKVYSTLAFCRDAAGLAGTS